MMRGGSMALNLNWHFSPILLLIVVINSQSVDENECAGIVPTISSFNDSYGGIDNFYTLAEGVTSRLQSNLNEEDVEILTRIYDSNFNNISAQDATYFFKKQTAAILILIVCAAFIVGLPVAGICFCSFRLCGRCGAKREQSRSSKCLLCTYLLLVIVTLAVIILAMLLYALSVKKAANAFETIDQPMDTVIKDAKQMITFMTDDLSCNMNATMSNLLVKIHNALSTLPFDILERFKQHYGYYDANAVIMDSSVLNRSLNETSLSINEAKRMLNALLVALPTDSEESQQIQTRLILLNALQQAINQMRINYDAVLRQIATGISDADIEIEKSKHTIEGTLVESTRKTGEMSAKIGEFIRMMKAAVDEFLKNGTGGMDEKLKKVHTNLNESPTKTILIKALYAAVLVPCLVIVFPSILVTICAAGRLLIKNDIPSERSSCTAFFGHLAIFAVSMIFILGWIVILIASYSIETVCYPLFHDDTMQLLKSAHMFTGNITSPLNGQKVSLNVGEALEECGQENTIFAALKGDQLMHLDATAIERNLSAVRLQVIDAFANRDLMPVLPIDTFNQINEALNSLRSSIQSFDTVLPFSINENSTAEAENQLKLVKHNLLNAANLLSEQLKRFDVIEKLWSNSSEDSRRRQPELILNEQFERVIANITAQIQHAKDSLLSETLNCRPVYDTWQNVGIVFCDYVGRPTQGIWSSAALIALCFLPLIVLLTLVSKYLLRMKPKYDRSMYLYPTISTLHGGSICAYDNGSGTSDVPLVRSGYDLALSRILPRFPAHQRQPSNAFYGYGNSAYKHDADSERPHLYNARMINRFPENRTSSLYASNVNEYPSSEHSYGQRIDNRWWQR